MQKRVQAPKFLASKWIHLQLLIDTDEMKSLLDSLGDFFFFSTMGIQEEGKNVLSKKQFLAQYGRYIQGLKSGTPIPDEELRFFFTSLLTKNEESVVSVEVSGGRQMYRALYPVVQMQLHRFDVSPVDHEIRPLVFGKGTISWGIQISYPQLFENPDTGKIEEPLKEDVYPNAALFRLMRDWIRKYTKPTPFMIEGKKVNAPIRIGLHCGWIHQHPDLQSKGIKVAL